MYLIYRRAIYIELLNWILPQAIETLRSDAGDRNENVTKAKGLITKTTTLHVHHAFLYISLPSLRDYDVKMLNLTLILARVFSPLLVTLEKRRKPDQVNFHRVWEFYSGQLETTAGKISAPVSFLILKSLSPPQRIPLGIPIKIAIIEK